MLAGDRDRDDFIILVREISFLLAINTRNCSDAQEGLSSCEQKLICRSSVLTGAERCNMMQVQQTKTFLVV